MTLADQTETEATRHARRIRRARHTVGSQAFYDSLEWLAARADAADEWKRLALDMGEALRRMVRTEFESMREQNATTFGGLDHYFSDEERETIAALLARLDGIGNKDEAA